MIVNGFLNICSLILIKSDQNLTIPFFGGIKVGGSPFLPIYIFRCPYSTLPFGLFLEYILKFPQKWVHFYHVILIQLTRYLQRRKTLLSNTCLSLVVGILSNVILFRSSFCSRSSIGDAYAAWNPSHAHLSLSVLSKRYIP